ncbi:ABC transporter permease [Bacillus sp. ISL-40]|uniref:ABC transporter permease n=1 Tax=unclassified Bacillus (in: firmicutes) TaxID=185979 RepID=UPI001BE6FCE2|nr:MULTISPECIES: ABC transporter permease [unclassified Bacillus (in: firmicutes)]MBT2699952.1 ABC transporter permease [Bacillus sp. ISL-40]MBT2722970.1 ABC transporter permease [Bacillus sp. ISL-46]MBT2740851.1 ABC transporter permease [Bacillus sp. ISL-77]
MFNLKGLSREFSIVIALIIMMVIFSIIDPIYLSYNNLIDIVDQSVINGLLAIGITYAIITAGIDLSIGSIFAIVIVVVGDLLVRGVNPILAIVAGAIIGFILGAINGLLITKLKLQPFIVTLGTMSGYRGLAYIITGGWPVLNIPSDYRTFLDGDLFGSIPVSVILLFAFAIVSHIILKYTKFGTYIYALGGNEEATRLSGVNVTRIKIYTYAFCGVAAALSGMILLARLGSGEPTAGQSYELNAIAAAAIGGASLAGGKGNILGTLLGALLLSALKVGLVVVGVDAFWQYIATGAIIVVAAYFEVIQEKLQKLNRKNSHLKTNIKNSLSEKVGS